jgi:hypothetical protein
MIAWLSRAAKAAAAAAADNNEVFRLRAGCWPDIPFELPAVYGGARHLHHLLPGAPPMQARVCRNFHAETV